MGSAVLNQTNISNERLKDDVEAARFLHISKALARKWRINGGGPRWFKIGNRVRYRDSDLIAFLDSCPSGGGRQVGV